MLLLVQEVLDGLGPGLLLGRWVCLGWGGLDLREEDLWATFLEALFKYGLGEALMHPGATGNTLVSASVGLPSVVCVIPGFGALLHQVSLVLLRLLALVSRGLVMDVVLWVFVDLGQPLHCMLVHQLVIVVEDLLPLLKFVVLKLLGPLPRREGCISLSASELGLIAGGLWCTCGLADVQDRDATKVLLRDFFEDVTEGCPALGLMPCFPDSGQLDDDFG